MLCVSCVMSISNAEMGWLLKWMGWRVIKLQRTREETFVRFNRAQQLNPTQPSSFRISITIIMIILHTIWLYISNISIYFFSFYWKSLCTCVYLGSFLCAHRKHNEQCRKSLIGTLVFHLTIKQFRGKCFSIQQKFVKHPLHEFCI